MGVNCPQKGSRLSQCFGNQDLPYSHRRVQSFPALTSNDFSSPRHNRILISWQNVDKLTKSLCFGSLASWSQRTHQESPHDPPLFAVQMGEQKPTEGWSAGGQGVLRSLKSHTCAWAAGWGQGGGHREMIKEGQVYADRWKINFWW